MVRTGVTIAATMFAAAIGIDAGVEADVGTVIGGDDGARGVPQKYGRRGHVIFGSSIGIALVDDLFEATGRIGGSAATVNWKCTVKHGDNRWQDNLYYS